MQNKRLLLVGSSGSVHLENYHNLIKDYFDEILIVSNVKIEYCSYKLLDFSLKKPWLLPNKVKSMRTIISDFAPSHIHVHQAGTFSYITALANKSKIPLVLTTWGSDVLITPHKNFLYKHLVKFSLRKANFITADAHFMAEAIKKMVNKEVLIANFGIDLESAIIPVKKNQVYSNRLHNPLYRIDKIIEGFANFNQINPDWKLIIGANGSETEKLIKLAEQLLPNEAYEFIGFVGQEENKKRYLESKIWISNPESDGTAISLLEAMGYGCVPVVSDLPANNEWINTEENGIIILDSISQGLEKANSLPIEKVQQLNKKIIETKATKQVNRDKFISLYNNI